MKYNFTEKRDITLRFKALNNGTWAAIVQSRGVSKYIFNKSEKSKALIIKRLQLIAKANAIHTELWTKFN